MDLIVIPLATHSCCNWFRINEHVKYHKNIASLRESWKSLGLEPFYFNIALLCRFTKAQAKDMHWLVTRCWKRTWEYMVFVSYSWDIPESLDTIECGMSGTLLFVIQYIQHNVHNVCDGWFFVGTLIPLLNRVTTVTTFAGVFFWQGEKV